MTAKESKAVACPGLGDRLIFAEQGERAEAEVFRTRSIGFMEHTSRADLYAEARLALHAAEAELGELRRMVGSAGDVVQMAINTLICSCRPAGNRDVDDAAEIRATVQALRQLRQLLASDGGEDGDDEGEGT